MQRYNITGINGSISDADIDDFVKNTVFAEIAAQSTMQLKPTDYAEAMSKGNVDNSDNVLMVTDMHNTRQVIKAKTPLPNEENQYIKIQCSSNTIDMMDMDKFKLSVYRLGLEKLNTLTESSATVGIDKVTKALERINKVRSAYGAYQNRLEHSYKSNTNTSENTQSAESLIRDTDMAKQMVTNSNTSILQQAGQAMLAQTKQAGNGVLSLLN